MMPTVTTQKFPLQAFTLDDLKSLKWGSILVGVGVGLFLPRGLRRLGGPLALIAGAFALKPLMALLHEDSVICADRPPHVDPIKSKEAEMPIHYEGEGSA
jgi:hypothetical protein